MPVIDWPIHEASQMVVISSSSEFEKTNVRTPPTRAHSGESASAWRPIFCSSSSSVPSLPGSLDSGEPRWISQTVKRMKSVNWRYSDCQFSSTATPKFDEVTYEIQATASSLCVICSALNSCQPAIDCS